MADCGLVVLDNLLALAPIEMGKLGHHVVLSAGGARVIVLAFERDHELKEHRTPHPLLMQALDGHLRVSVDERVVDLRPGGLLHLPASMPHSVTAAEDSRLSLTLLGV